MRTNYCFLFIALCALITFSNCKKDQLEMPLSEVPSDTNTFGALIPAASDPRNSSATVPCDHIPPQTNYISILFRNQDGSITPSTCLTEKEIMQVLEEGGKQSEEASALLSKLFYQAEYATPADAYQLGHLIARFYGYSEESFNIDLMGRSDYPASALAPGAIKQGPLPGFIDFYTIRQAHAAPGEGLMLQSGFSGLRFQNQCTGQMVTFDFPTTLDGFKRTFLSAGFSQKKTDLLVRNIIDGNYSIRQIWDLFQLQLAPNLPIAKTLLSKPDGDCWRLRQVGIGLYNGLLTSTSFYFAQGDGALR